MKRLGLALMLLGLATGPSLAQADPAASSASTASSAGPSSSASEAPAADRFQFASVVAGIASKEPSWSNLDKIDKKTTVTFVELSSLSGYDTASLNFPPATLAVLKALDAKVGRNNALMRKLWKAGFEFGDVVGVEVDAPGNAVVFINL